jgi:hypothetical protein
MENGEFDEDEVQSEHTKESALALYVDCNLNSKTYATIVTTDWSCEELLDVKLYVTCGFDSSAGHLNPHQNYANTNNINHDAQQSLLVTSCIIQKLAGSNNSAWINPTPQSTRF